MTTTMQLIEQTFELIIIDQFVDLFLHRLQRIGLRRAAMLTLTMQLVEQGKLDLDADLNQYIDFKIPARDGKPMETDALAHRALLQELDMLRDVLALAPMPIWRESASL